MQTCRSLAAALLTAVIVALPAFGQATTQATSTEPGSWSAYGSPVDSVGTIQTGTYLDGLAYFKSGKPAVIAAAGEVPEYYVRVYDRKGKLVAADVRADTSFRVCAWTPKYTGAYLVRVVAFHGRVDRPIWVAVWSNHRGY